MGISAAAWVTRVRLTTGLILFTYVTTHLLNHALGLVSLIAMEIGREWFLRLWRTPVGTVALYGSVVTHVALAWWSLYRRRTLSMPRWEALQLVLGLLVPPLLAAHVVGTRLAHEWFGVTDSYTRTVLVLWHLGPHSGTRQVVVLAIAWLHGTIGIHFWLRLRPWYRTASPGLLAGAMLVPVLALLGFVRAGNEVAALASQPGFVESVLRETGTNPARSAALRLVVPLVVGVHGLGVAGALALRGVRRRRERRAGAIRLTYPGGREVVVPRGFSVLEASRFAGIPHASVCGGRGRCSTCRIRIADGAALPAPSADEALVLRRVGAPPNVRLACQLRPLGPLVVTPVLPARVGPEASFARSGPGRGEERDVVVLFADLRGFTRLAERKLPYDVVFFLNRYFEAVASTIERADGVANQFTGDGVMALFGVDGGPEHGSRQALAAARGMVASLARLSDQLAEELDEPLRMGIGIHAGSAVVGEMGYGTTTYLTAVGDTVHVASRLEALTKEYACELVVSDRIVTLAGLDTAAYARYELTLRNRTEPLAIWVIPEVATLPMATRQPDAG
jgi:adenylate cyclase